MNKDTTSNPPSPNAANANPFAYGDGNPLGGTDPTGHSFFTTPFGGPADSPPPATTPSSTRSLTGAARYSVCLPMCSSGSGLETAVACSMRYEAFWPPAVTLTASGQWNEP